MNSFVWFYGYHIFKLKEKKENSIEERKIDKKTKKIKFSFPEKKLVA
jgi:hypothetical protein